MHALQRAGIFPCRIARVYDDFGDDGPEDFDEPSWSQKPRDPVIDLAKKDLDEFFLSNPREVFYERQVQILFESTYFHWITSRALGELADEGVIASELETLQEPVRIRFYRLRSHRYWRRQGQEILDLVKQFSTYEFASALGHHGETMFDAALPTVGFMPMATKVREHEGRMWTASGHDLDRVYQRDGIYYGAEIKNTLPYISLGELNFKIAMCHHFGIRPLFIVRSAPKNYIQAVRLAGGFTLVFKYQLYPFGHKKFADMVRSRLGIPVDCPARIGDGTVQRFLKWHLACLDRR